MDSLRKPSPINNQCFSRLLIVVVVALFTQTADAQIVRIENDQNSSDTNRWSGSADLSIYSVKNNFQFFKLASGSQLKYSKNKTTFLSINELRLFFASQDDLENRGFQHFRFQRRLDSVFTWEAFTQLQFDQVLKIKLRQLNGIGPRVQLYRKTKSKVFLGLHYMFEYEKEYDTEIVNRDHRLSSHFAFSRTLKKSSIHCIMYFQPKIDDLKDYRVSGSTTYSIELRKQVLFNIRGELAYDSNPVMGVENLTYTFLNGFGLVF